MTSQTGITSAAAIEAGEPPIRYLMAGHTVGLPTLEQYLRALIGGGALFGLPPLAARWLARRERRAALHRLERWWTRRLFDRLAIRLDLEGAALIDPDERYIVVALHESFLDVPALLHLPLPLRFAARDEIFGWRVLGPYLRDTGQLCITPERGRWSYRRLLRDARAVLDGGESIVIFPQGTILGIETSFLRGAFALAQALGRPLLPVALTGGHRVWEHPFTPRLRFGQRISMRVLPPIPAGDVAGQASEQLRLDVQRQLKAEALSGTMAAPRHYLPARDGYWDGFAFQIDPAFPALAADMARRRQQIAAEQPV